MPAVALENLPESLLFYWVKLARLSRDMINFAPDSNFPVFLNGKKISPFLELARKLYPNNFSKSNYLFLVCDEKVTEFKCLMRLNFSVLDESRWNNYVVRFILVLWELIMVCTYHQPVDTRIPLLKLSDFRLSGMLYCIIIFIKYSSFHHSPPSDTVYDPCFNQLPFRLSVEGTIQPSSAKSLWSANRLYLFTIHATRK